MLELSSANFKEHVKKGSTVVVDCWAEWCGPCRTMAKPFAKVSEKFAEKATFAKFDIDSDEKLANKLKIESIPTFIVFVDGKEVERQTGGSPQRELEKFIERAISGEV